MGLRQNQSPADNVTDNISLEDETMNTNRAATAIPHLIGEGKTAIRWLTPIYGQRTIKAPSKASSKNK